MKRLGVAFAVVVSMILAGVSGPPTVSAQGGSGQMSTITVSGVGTAAGQPDIASVELGFQTVNTNLNAAITQANDTTEAILQGLAKLNIAPTDIQMLKMVVSPSDQGQDKTQTGNFVYTVRRVLRVTTRNVGQINDLINAALTSGANLVDNLTFGIDDMGTLEQEARAQAISNARARATQLAQGLGVAVGDPFTITETVTNVSQIAQPGTGNRGAAFKGGNDTETGTGQFIVTVQINVTFMLTKAR